VKLVVVVWKCSSSRLFGSKLIRMAVGDPSNRLEADKGPSLVSGSCGDAGGLALTSEAEHAVDVVAEKVHMH